MNEQMRRAFLMVTRPENNFVVFEGSLDKFVISNHVIDLEETFSAKTLNPSIILTLLTVLFNSSPLEEDFEDMEVSDEIAVLFSRDENGALRTHIRLENVTHSISVTNLRKLLAQLLTFIGDDNDTF